MKSSLPCGLHCTLFRFNIFHVLNALIAISESYHRWSNCKAFLQTDDLINLFLGLQIQTNAVESLVFAEKKVELYNDHCLVVGIVHYADQEKNFITVLQV